MSECKLRVKVGMVEIEFEGSESFIKAELPNLIEKLTDLNKRISPEPEIGDRKRPPDVNVNEKGSTRDIAAKIGAKTGTHLALAAALHLTVGANKGQFSKKELLTEMKTAHGYYKATFGRNLGAYLKTLTNKKKLSEVASDTFAVTAVCKKEMEVKLADG